MRIDSPSSQEAEYRTDHTETAPQTSLSRGNSPEQNKTNQTAIKRLRPEELAEGADGPESHKKRRLMKGSESSSDELISAIAEQQLSAVDQPAQLSEAEYLSWELFQKLAHSPFAEMASVLGEGYFDALCKQALASEGICIRPALVQIIYLLSKYQYDRVENCLQSEELTKAFFAGKGERSATEFFLHTEQWINDFNLLVMAAEIKSVRLAALQALVAVNGGDFDIHAEADKIRQLLDMDDQREEIDLEQIGLTDLPKEISTFHKLTTLHLSGNRLWQPRHLESLPKLSIVDLSQNRISPACQLSSNTCGIKALKLSRNNLETLPKMIFQLPLLNTLDLSDNCLADIDPAISQLTQLKALYLGDNKIRRLPAEINHLTNLLELNVSNNSLKKLPDISGLVHLRKLDISENALTTIPKEVCDLPRLQFLNISNIPLQAIPCELFENPVLKRLTISKEQKELLPPQHAMRTVDIEVIDELTTDSCSQSIGEVTEDYESDFDSSLYCSYTTFS